MECDYSISRNQANDNDTTLHLHSRRCRAATQQHFQEGKILGHGDLGVRRAGRNQVDRLADQLAGGGIIGHQNIPLSYLLERAAGAVADSIFAAFARVKAVKVTVHKPHAPIAAIFDDVGVIIHRARS